MHPPNKSLSAYENCLAKMFSLHRFGIILGLDTIADMLKKLGDPQRNFNCIHIAGTNGKGSIASWLATMLRNAGQKVGLYTSPHLVKFNERIQIDGRPIEDDRVISLYETVLEANHGERQATFFEFATAMALYEFSRLHVDWAIIETGMGGRLDATNIILPKLSIITNISLEHQSYLGDTLEEIAAEKAGIIKPGVPVVTGVEQPSVIQVVEAASSKNNSPCYRKDKDFQIHLNADGTLDYAGIDCQMKNVNIGLAGNHQLDNAAIVLAACEQLKRQGVDISEEVIRTSLLENNWPGRLEKVMDRPRVILDGAHNLTAAQVLADYIKQEFSLTRTTLVVGILDDKPYEAMLKILVPTCSKVILTQPKINRALNPQTLLPLVQSLSNEVEIIPDVACALQTAIAQSLPEDAVCVAGSLYVVGEAKESLGKTAQAA